MTAFSPKPFVGSNEDIETLAGRVKSIAEEVLRENAEAVGVGEFLRKMVSLWRGEIHVSRAPTPAEEPGGSLVIEPGGRAFKIWLSPYTSPLRDHFTIGHELGHYFLHYPHGNPVEHAVSFTRYGSSVIEWQANRFSAALLMPQGEFKKKWQELQGDSFAVAGHFGVSEPAVSVRQKSLSVL